MSYNIYIKSARVSDFLALSIWFLPVTTTTNRSDLYIDKRLRIKVE
jgi:hypothetical protein